MSAYDMLDDETKLGEAIRFVAVGQPLPRALEDFLVQQGLYELITNPGVSTNDSNKQGSASPH